MLLRTACAVVLLCAATLAAETPAPAADGDNPLACRLASYGEYQDAAWTHLPSLGIRHVFMNTPKPGEVETTQQRLKAHGLTAVVLRGDADLSQPPGLDRLAAQLETCRRMGVNYLFLSLKQQNVEKSVMYQRLRQAGDLAAKQGVILALETHPGLGTNADVQRETMTQVNHPNVRVNFDTGNISFYNRGREAAAELRKIIDYVATVELKDHNGEPESWHFPALGRGVVNLRAVLEILRDHRFSGPITMEIEGVQGVRRSQAEVERDIAESVGYVRSLGYPAWERRLVARIHDSGFPFAHDTYNGMGTGSDGRIYYVLCSESLDVAAKMYAYDPAMDRIRLLGDLTEACGEAGLKAIPQGKSHVPFVESDGKLYFATHVGYYSIVDGMEKIGIPPGGYQPYPGGHFLAYDIANGKFEDLGKAPHGEGILTMSMDARRGRLYGITWPAGHVLRLDLRTHELKNLGTFAKEGENGRGASYRTLCRSMAVNPADGSMYFSNGDGAILRYRYETDAVETVVGEDLRKDYFGLYDPTSPGHMGYNWRQTVWYPPEAAVYGVHGNSGYLFRYVPGRNQVEVLDRLTSQPSQLSGMFDQFSYGYLGFTLGPDGQTIYYLTGGPVYVDGKRVKGKDSTAMGESKGVENLHLVTYSIPHRRYRDHGPIFFENGDRPAYVNAIAVGQDGTVYTLSRVKRDGKTLTDLISIKSPFHRE